MIRCILMTVIVGTLTPVVARAIVPPIPRIPIEWLNPSAQQPMAADEATPDDPASLADRILQNSRAAGDRLASADPGVQTRRTQNAILQDIDKLLQLANNPPPSGGGGAGGTPPSPMGNSDPTSGQSNSGGSSSSPPKDRNAPRSPDTPSQSQSGSQSGSSGTTPQPKAGQTARSGGQTPPRKTGWRDREQQKQARRKSGDGTPKPMGSPSQTAQNPQPKHPQPMPGAGQSASVAPGPQPRNGTGTRGGTQSVTAPPLDDPYTKQVWGHLPEQMRQKMTQYYREQFVSRYGDLLRQYYSSLAEREKSGGKR